MQHSRQRAPWLEFDAALSECLPKIVLERSTVAVLSMCVCTTLGRAMIVIIGYFGLQVVHVFICTENSACVRMLTEGVSSCRGALLLLFDWQQ